MQMGRGVLKNELTNKKHATLTAIGNTLYNDPVGSVQLNPDNDTLTLRYKQPQLHKR